MAFVLQIGSCLEEGVQLRPQVSEGQYRKVMQLVDLGSSEAQLLFGGRRPAHLKRGYFLKECACAGR
ncbi:TPA: aldehyde dehydrogenase family protein [Pseudomonas aeruginosa]|uniref:aldehyde dehydrogenase family protein n=1 Tax=Pseudomonas aeruginosa TaxID=287 RepID=UPI00053DCFFE|nr:aldehyde dehydrogenase family protein [Pseudomonas aeruginosa]HBN9879239.1 aldehyde dehydrogenase family protein [Pseudomonas aeruginosa]HBN9880042.1 aldehyde dehydrogenase family protein [Pseudomonas aeruginosa]HBO1241445.1 aldehyde dehydrogenase family protein [Pseudomonas aeruginosa]HBO1880707.1 aldehyde dehydrogenase family protein [Pseudomonas aeruginosa]